MELEPGEVAAGVPVGGADDDGAGGVQGAEGGQRARGQLVPGVGGVAAHLVEQLEHDVGCAGEMAFEGEPEVDEAILELGGVEEGDILGDVAVVADGLVEIEDRREAGRMAPADEAVQQRQDALAVDAGTLLQDKLVEAQADVVEAQRGDVVDVGLGDVGVEVLEVADGEDKALGQRQDIEALVVGEPAADAHALLELAGVVCVHHGVT